MSGVAQTTAALYTVGIMSADITAALTQLTGTTAAALTRYILPLIWTCISIVVLLYGFAVMRGSAQRPAQELVWKFCVWFFLLWLMQASVYQRLIVRPITNLPSELVGVATTGNSKPMTIIDAFEKKITNVTAGIFLYAEKLPLVHVSTAIAANVFGAIFAAVGALLVVAGALSQLFSQVSTQLLLSVGPIWIAFLMFEKTKSWFQAWLNTLLYFLTLGLLSTIAILIFITVTDKLVYRLFGVTNISGGDAAIVTQVSQALSSTITISVVVSQFAIMAGLVAVMFIQLPRLATGLTHGSGGSLSEGVSSIINLGASASRIATGLAKGKK